jgi:Tfp pilus assembly protein PilV
MSAGPVVAHAWSTILGMTVRRAMEAEQRGDLRIGDENDVASVAAIAAIRTGKGFEFFTTNGHTSVAAVASAKVQRHLVNKSGHSRAPSDSECWLKYKGEPKLAPAENY